MLAVDRDESLVADAPCEDVDLRLEFVHREDAALLRCVPLAEAAVLASVHAEVGHVERREHHDAVVVDLVLDAVRRRTHFLEERRIRDGHEDGRLLGEKRLARRLALRDYLPHARRIRRLFRDLGYAAVYLRLVDEMPSAGEILVYLLLNDEIPAVVVRILELPYLRYIRHVLKLAFNALFGALRGYYTIIDGLRSTRKLRLLAASEGSSSGNPRRIRRIPSLGPSLHRQLRFASKQRCVAPVGSPASEHVCGGSWARFWHLMQSPVCVACTTMHIMGDGIRSERHGIIPRSGIWARAVPKTRPAQAAANDQRFMV